MRKMLGRRGPRRFLVAMGLLVGAMSLTGARGAYGESAQADTVVVGQVTDERSKQGVVGVSVQVEDTRFGAITGEDGRFRIVNLPAGPYTWSRGASPTRRSGNR